MSQSAAQATAFFKEVSESGIVWAIKDENGFPAPLGESGVRAMPFWSSENRVQEIIKNVPAYKDRDNSDYGAVDRIVGEFKRMKAENPNAEFIVYCYSTPCMTGRKIGNMLAEHDIYVKHLGVGWNEWRYYWTLFNHPHEWETTSPEQYITSGPEPGVPDTDLTGTGCPIEGGLGC